MSRKPAKVAEKGAPEKWSTPLTAYVVPVPASAFSSRSRITVQ